MNKLIKRHIYGELRESLEDTPVVALIGPRQCGKSTLAKMIQAEFPGSLYLDLENPIALEKLADPEFFLSRNLAGTPRKARFSRVLRSSPAIYTAKSRFASPAANAMYICAFAGPVPSARL